MPMNPRLLRPRQKGKYNALRVGLAHYWPLNETTGGTQSAADWIGGATLTANNSPAAVAGKINNGRAFLRTSSQSLSTSTASAGVLHRANSSIAFWFRRDDTESVTSGRGLITSDTAFSNRGNAITMLSGGEVYIQFIGLAGVSYAPGTGVYWFLGLPLASPSWNFFAATRNGTAVTARLNGTAYSATLASNVTPNNGTIIVNARSYGPSDFSTATIDEIAIWNRTLSSAELDTLYNAGAGIDLRA